MEYQALLKSGSGRYTYKVKASTSWTAVQEAIRIHHDDGAEPEGYNDVLEVIVIPQSAPGQS